MQENLDFHIANLITKYLKGETTLQETEELKTWSNQNSANKSLFDKLTNADYVGKQIMNWENDIQRKDLWNRIQEVTHPTTARRRSLFKRLAIAASIFLPLCVISLLFLKYNDDIKNLFFKENRISSNVAQSKENETGQVKLILNDGSTVELEENAAKRLNEKDGTVIESENQILTYNTSETNSEHSIYNTIIVPRGKEYQLVLADGTKVWLNSASSLRFPTHFTKEKRQVYLKGEAYFEVVENKKMPFEVIANKVSVNVLGTHFNVMAYENEPEIKTTLLEGSVNVSNGKQSYVLKPGEQAQITDEKIKVSETDADLSIAWKNGLLSFNNSDIQKVMRQIERWYDIEVVFEGKMPKNRLTGEISKKAKLSEVLDMLAYKELDVKIKTGNERITVKAAN